MEKPAVTKHNINKHIKSRWSPRAFSDKPVPKEALQRISEAAKWAPSAYNEQPWRFFVGLKGDTTWKKIFDTLVEFNQGWAKLAPVLILSVGSKKFSANGHPNNVFTYDVGQSAAYITFQATEEGLHVHQMSGFDPNKASELFGIPNDFQALTVIALGYKGDPSLLDDGLRSAEAKPRSRKESKELFFSESFGKASPLFE